MKSGLVAIGFLTPGTGLLYRGREPSEAGSCPAHARSDQRNFRVSKWLERGDELEMMKSTPVFVCALFFLARQLREGSLSIHWGKNEVVEVACATDHSRHEGAYEEVQCNAGSMTTPRQAEVLREGAMMVILEG